MCRALALTWSLSDGKEGSSHVEFTLSSEFFKDANAVAVGDLGALLGEATFDSSSSSGFVAPAGFSSSSENCVHPALLRISHLLSVSAVKVQWEAGFNVSSEFLGDGVLARGGEVSAGAAATFEKEEESSAFGVILLGDVLLFFSSRVPPPPPMESFGGGVVISAGSVVLMIGPLAVNPRAMWDKETESLLSSKGFVLKNYEIVEPWSSAVSLSRRSRRASRWQISIVPRLHRSSYSTESHWFTPQNGFDCSKREALYGRKKRKGCPTKHRSAMSNEHNDCDRRPKTEHL